MVLISLYKILQRYCFLIFFCDLPIPVDAAIESFETVERRAIQDADDGTKMARKNDSVTSYEESTTINYNRDGEDTLKRESAVERETKVVFSWKRKQ